MATYSVASYGGNSSGSVRFYYNIPSGSKINKIYFTFNPPGKSTWIDYNGVTLAGAISSSGTIHEGFGNPFNLQLGTSGTFYVSIRGGSLGNIHLCVDYDGQVVDPLATISVESGYETIELGTASHLQLGNFDATKYTYYISYQLGTINYQVQTDTNYYNMTIPLEWANQVVYGTSATMKAIVSTFKNGAWIGNNECSFVVTIPANIVPTIDSSSFQVVGQDMFNDYVQQNKSKAKISWKSSGASGSTVTSWRLTGNNLIVSEGSGEKDSVITDILTTPGTNTWTLTVTDTRGRTATSRVSLNVTAYTPPVLVSYRAFRSDYDGEENKSGKHVSALMTYAYTALEGNNLISRISISNSSLVPPKQNIVENPVSGELYIFGSEVDLGAVYGIEYYIIDSVGNSVTASEQIPTAYVFMRWDRAKNSFGFGAYPSGRNEVFLNDEWNLHVHGQEIQNLIDSRIAEALGENGSVTTAITNNLKKAYPVGAIYISTTETNPNTLFGFGTWEQIQDRFLLASGTTYEAGFTGGKALRVLAAAMGNFDDTETVAGYYAFKPTEFQKLNYAPPFEFTTRSRGRTPSTVSWNHSVPVTEYKVNDNDVVRGDGYTDFMPPYLTVYMWKRTK